jgi:predicted ATPase
VVDLNVEEDTTNREYRVDLSMRDDLPFSSRVVSDGTLRILAFLTLLHDPKHRGLVCFEEPENGVHHSRLKAMIRRLRELVSNPFSEEADEQEPLSQMLLNSHSPVVLSELQQGEIMFSDILTVVDPATHQRGRKTRIRPAQDQGELQPDSGTEFVSTFEVDRYLSSVN